MHQISKVIGQSASAGAWPTLRAATDPTLHGGEYIGPASMGGTRGRPVPVGMDRLARDEALADEIWSASETATAVNFEV
ncbi:hypothetical protein [Aeromicrobium sp. UC242_57]|uniref:hypothetical protein n=1 Tax=Aeromicrobium sp. UC242_57 TaxID=3374624 RepID=UPI0037BF4A61